MGNNPSDSDHHLPPDEHLQQDISSAEASATEEPSEGHLVPGQTNAGQQVSGLASASGYGEADDPDTAGDANNPV